MKLSGIGYMMAGSLGVIFFTTMALERFEDRLMLENGADEALWTITGKVEEAKESSGIRHDLVVRLDSDTMSFVGGEVYPRLYQFGNGTAERLKPGTFVTVQVERERFMKKRIEAQRGGSNEIQIASLSSPKENLLLLDNYLQWRKRDSLNGLFLMPCLALGSLIIVALGWNHRKERIKRVPLKLSSAARIRT
ncbi:MAG: hypothetical protein KDN22_27315 [Verrucomicrobiae bacterium]|nr:hypothetical protein [Verrucomicrobiae bacterium]